ncbi:MAG: YbbR-like domain-containing protein [Actinomycetota bacterium]
MNVLKHNWPIKVLSLVVGIVLSVYVRGQQDRISRTLVLPVIIPTPEGQRVVEPSAGTQVVVNLEGPGELVQALDTEQVKLEIDTSGVQPGATVRVPISVEIPEKLRNQGVEAVWRPRSIRVKLISDATRQAPVEVQVLDPPEGWELTANPQITPPQVTISGAQQDVARVARVVAQLPLEAEERISKLVTVQAFDADGVNITDQVRRLAPAQVLVAVTQQRVLLQKDVPVQPIVRIPPGARVSVRVTPDQVRLLGPARRLGGIYFVETAPVQLPTGRGAVSREVALISPNKDVTLRPDRVKVTVQVLPAAGAQP